ncbi:MAG TPA: endonuclease III domain-containing protein [Terriglobia bacterium]|jgi:endonuclease-3 related protein|nr:endonuclease III domain-containing protein [Terriglobia bacterium]
MLQPSDASTYGRPGAPAGAQENSGPARVRAGRRNIIATTPAGKGQLRPYYRRLLEEFGPQGWWPAETRLEVILGAILTQNTTWRNAALAIARLRDAGMLDLARLRAIQPDLLESLIRPAGFYRQKARAIRNFVLWLDDAHGGSLDRMFALPGEDLRQALLQLKGLGPETADAILLYAGGLPFFVADAYTRRILIRHGVLGRDADYAEAQRSIHRGLKRDAGVYNEFHALLVEAGKRYCRRDEPRCESCPLGAFLPQGGPVPLTAAS